MRSKVTVNFCVQIGLIERTTVTAARLCFNGTLMNILTLEKKIIAKDIKLVKTCGNSIIFLWYFRNEYKC